MVSGGDIAIGCTMLTVMLIGVQFRLALIEDALNRIARALEKRNHEEDAP